MLKQKSIDSGKIRFGGFVVLFFLTVVLGSPLFAYEKTQTPPENSEKTELSEKEDRTYPRLDNWPEWRKNSKPAVQRWPNWFRTRKQPPPIYRYSPPGYQDNPIRQNIVATLLMGIVLGMFLSFVVGQIIVGGLPSNLLAAGLSVTEQRSALLGSVSIVIMCLVLSAGGVFAYYMFTGGYVFPVEFYNMYFDLVWLGVPLIGLIIGVSLARFNYRHRLMESVQEHI